MNCWIRILLYDDIQMKKTLLSLLLLITGVATFFTGTVEAID
jgi:hypothetical protein